MSELSKSGKYPSIFAFFEAKVKELEAMAARVEAEFKDEYPDQYNKYKEKIDVPSHYLRTYISKYSPKLDKLKAFLGL